MSWVVAIELDVAWESVMEGLGPALNFLGTCHQVRLDDNRCFTTPTRKIHQTVDGVDRSDGNPLVYWNGSRVRTCYR